MTTHILRSLSKDLITCMEQQLRSFLWTMKMILRQETRTRTEALRESSIRSLVIDMHWKPTMWRVQSTWPSTCSVTWLLASIKCACCSPRNQKIATTLSMSCSRCNSLSRQGYQNSSKKGLRSRPDIRASLMLSRTVCSNYHQLCL